jgi:DNA-binding response OmpR family regulator/nitrogen-specific signal transduction histidine kinase
LADLLLDGKIEEIEQYSKKFFKAKHCLRGYTAEKWISLNDQKLYMRFTATSVLNSNGEIIKVIETIEDRTEQKKIREKKELFNSVFRHDANNMINVCHGFLKLLKDTALSEEQEQYVQEALNSARGVISIIEKVGKLQKIGDEETRELSIKELIQEVVEKSKFQAKKKGISIEVSIPDFQSKVQAGGLLEDVFVNLIGNSIQHSGCDTIQISGRENNDEIICSIEDNGRGIKEENKEKLFDRGFKQGKNAGSGLGLFLVKKITKNYGGHIEVSDSSIGGVKFEVYLKKSRNETQESEDISSRIKGDLPLDDDQIEYSPDSSQDLIIVVDDNKQFLYYMEILLENNGFEAETFKNAEDALSFLKNKDYSSVPDLIISDIRMPDLSGYDFFKKLSSDPKLNRIPFIFLSGLTSKEDIRLGKILGADDYITKPVHEKDIIASIKGKLRRKKTEHLFKKEIDKYVKLKDSPEEKVEDNEDVTLFLTFWDDKKGPKLIEQYPKKSINDLSVNKLGTQIFQAIVPIYGQSKNISQSQDLLFKIDNVNKHAYLFFDAFYDESKRSKQTEFMVAIIAPTISYFESLKLKKVVSRLSSMVKEEKGAETIDFEAFWNKIIDRLKNIET